MGREGSPRFAFVQLELPWDLGPPAGRYVLRGHAGEPEHVLVLQGHGSRPQGRLGARRARRVDAGPEPATVSITRATLVDAVPIGDEREARAWLAGADLAARAEAAVDVLNRVLHAQRIVRADPFVREVALEQALAVRVGVGRGEEVAEGEWTEARGVPRPRPRAERRAGALRPQERFAALLSGRDVALAAEELTLRARLDLDRGRTREAALQARVALEAALAELQAWSHRADLAGRLDELRGHRAAVADAANRALEGGLDADQIAAVQAVVARLEAALAARVAGGLE
ncbi:hypothetical protein FSW04_22880 [Baekduia soli]|uniref:Uncharacterized protein n=1 Tax=Baekduia soli TaxID=496014 RepID=A0A5B8UAT6_9ACTN|nr:hypothetical protein [Baekduia soli]QEC50137.1 hypothetical protein FSW04_22880 [Baekduia soli]